MARNQIATRFYPTEDAADSAMRRWNKLAVPRWPGDNPRNGLAVLVDGPDGDFAVMPIGEAIGGGFGYTWAA